MRVLSLRFSRFSVLAGLLFLWPPGSPHCRADEIAVFYALDADLQALKEGTRPLGNPKQVHGNTIYAMEIGDHRVHAVKMGSGVIDTAISATVLLAKIPCDLTISIGPAGRLTEDLSIGRWVKVRSVIAYQQGTAAGNGIEIAPDAARDLSGLSTNDASLPEAWKEAPSIPVASGSLFVASDSFRRELQARTGAAAVDMNLAGLSAVCARFDLPLWCWKVISDSADERAGADFRGFVAAYKGEGGRWVADVIRHLPENPNSVPAHPDLQKLIGGD